MAWKMCLAAAVLFYCSELAISLFIDSGHPDLQKVGAVSAVLRQKLDVATLVENVPAADLSTIAQTPFADYNADIQANRYPLDAADLESLVVSGALSLPHPDGGTLDIVLQSTTTQPGSRTLHVLSSGYPGTITQRPNGFFATLATPEGVYTLENRGAGTYLVRHRQLDLRINPALVDYVHAPQV